MSVCLDRFAYGFSDPVDLQQINISAVSGVTVPVTGIFPDVTVDETEEYTATISLLPADTTFKGSKVYTATIIIIQKQAIH